MDRTYRFTYLFDPLCGWCYAAAPALERIAERHGDSLRLVPTGLFSELRPVATIADHARANDDRIQELTGQPFTNAYHQGVMRAPGGLLSSLPLTRALVALGLIDPALEPRFLHEAAFRSMRLICGSGSRKTRSLPPKQTAAFLKAGR